MRDRICSVLLGIFLLCNISYAQDVRFSQFYANKLYLNPALAGSDNYSHFSMNYRNQWPNLDLPFVTYSMSYDRYSKSLNGGVGVMVFQDNQGKGALKTTTVSGMYSYYLQINEKLVLRTALELSFIQKKLDWDKLVFPDQVSPIYGSVYPHNPSGDPDRRSRAGVDFSSGLVASYGNYYFGASVNHLSQPNINFNEDVDAPLPMRYTLHAGAEYELGKERYNTFTIAPSFLFQKQGDFSQMNYGFYVSKRSLVTGVWVNQNFELDYDAMIFLVGIDNKRFRVAYSFDYAVSKLVKTNTGAHEISVSFMVGDRRTKHRIKSVRCPRF